MRDKTYGLAIKADKLEKTYSSVNPTEIDRKNSRYIIF